LGFRDHLAVAVLRIELASWHAALSLLMLMLMLMLMPMPVVRLS
jgi:hypothetical protein